MPGSLHPGLEVPRGPSAGPAPAWPAGARGPAGRVPGCQGDGRSWLSVLVCWGGQAHPSEQMPAQKRGVGQPPDTCPDWVTAVPTQSPAPPAGSLPSPSTPASADVPGAAGTGRWGIDQGPRREGAGAEQAAGVHAGVWGGPVAGGWGETVRLEEAQPADCTAEGLGLLGRGGWPHSRDGPGQGRWWGRLDWRGAPRLQRRGQHPALLPAESAHPALPVQGGSSLVGRQAGKSPPVRTVWAGGLGALVGQQAERLFLLRNQHRLRPLGFCGVGSGRRGAACMPVPLTASHLCPGQCQPPQAGQSLLSGRGRPCRHPLLRLLSTPLFWRDLALQWLLSVTVTLGSPRRPQP